MGAKVLVVHAVLFPVSMRRSRRKPHIQQGDCNILFRFPARQAKFAAERLGNMPPFLRYHLTTADASGVLDSHAGARACLNRIAATCEAFTWLSHKCRVPVRRRRQLPPQ